MLIHSPVKKKKKKKKKKFAVFQIILNFFFKNSNDLKHLNSKKDTFLLIFF